MLAKPQKITVSQLQKDVQNVEKGMRLYLENSFVCLYSVKKNNPDVKCILFTSFDIGEEWKKRFSDADISIIQIEFGKYQIGSQFDWGIVQFRYDVMNYLCNNLDLDDNIIMLDTDIICVGSLDTAFSEIDERICLYDVQHNANHPDRLNIINNYSKIYSVKSKKYITHYGGEFIGSKIKYLNQLFEESVQIMNLSEKINNLTNFNDEHITSIAVDNLRKILFVNNANAYISRYWTSKGFYLTSTNHTFNAVPLWHMPLEKNRGFLFVYNYIVNNNRIPSKKSLISIFGLPTAKRHHPITNYLIQIWLKCFRK